MGWHSHGSNISGAFLGTLSAKARSHSLSVDKQVVTTHYRAEIWILSNSGMQGLKAVRIADIIGILDGYKVASRKGYRGVDSDCFSTVLLADQPDACVTSN